MKTPKISVIVPVYNAEKYLRKCVDSILGQTFQDFELLLIDDGSPDGSGAICDEYARRDSRVRVFHSINNGVTAARQKGLDEAIGVWVCFVDADDYLPGTSLATLYSFTEDVDIVQGGVEYDDGQKCYPVSTVVRIDSREWISKMLGGTIISGPVSKLIRRERLMPSVLKLPKDIVYGEDLIGNIRVAGCCRKVVIIPDTVYVYRRNLASVSHTFTYTLSYGETLYRIAQRELKAVGLDETSKSVKIFYLNILKHVLSAGQYDRTDSFVKAYLPKIKFRDVKSLKDVLWLFVLRVDCLTRLYTRFRAR